MSSFFYCVFFSISSILLFLLSYLHFSSPLLSSPLLSSPLLSSLLFHFFLSYQLDELSLALDSGRLCGVRTNTSSFEQTSTSFSSSLNSSISNKTTAEHYDRRIERSRRMECSVPAKKDSFLLALINILEEDIYRLIGQMKY